jgi:glycosyltransferase involved in cell wall biosynthesis
MKILTIHNRYQLRGGEDEVFEREVQLLRSKGHTVIEYVETNDHVGDANPLRSGLDAVWAKETVRRIRGVIQCERPDIAHFHNTFARISPAAYYACGQAGVPVVQTLHNFRTGCLNACCATAQGPCERCLTNIIPLTGILKGCYRGSRVGSAAMAAITATHKLLGTYRRQVDAFIALSEFGRSIQVRSGIPNHKLFVKPNFTDPQPDGWQSGQTHALFVGRLCPEKGIATLLEAWAQAGLTIPLRIAGDGPSAPWVADAAARIPTVEWLGARTRLEVMELMRDAQFLIMPSLLYESFGLCIVEAFSAGVPCIVSGHGSMQELVEDGRTGLHFRPGDSLDLASKLQWMAAHPTERQQMGLAARECFQIRYTPEENYRLLMQIYSAASANAQIARKHTESEIAQSAAAY